MRRNGSPNAREIDRDYKMQLKYKDRVNKICGKRVCKNCNYAKICELKEE